MRPTESTTDPTGDACAVKVAASPAVGAGLDLTQRQRHDLLARMGEVIERVTARLHEHPVARPVTPEAVREELANLDLEVPHDPEEAVDTVVDLLTRYAVHVPHPRYFGLFNPAPAFMGVVADALVAAFNPQLAAFSHAPAAVEIERRLIRFLAGRFGLDVESATGTFTTGGAEANQTGLLLALTRSFPELSHTGLRGLPGQPVFYASAESHHAWFKIARAAGLGESGLRLIPTDRRLRLDVDSLARAMAEDRAAGRLPFLVAATAGTTSAGAVDPLPAIADLADAEGLHLHVDAAWAGSASLSDRVRPLLAGIELADSVTVDAHKWLSVPMGAGVFVTTHGAALHRTFKVSTAYMPEDNEEAIDPYVTSVQWSRRFIGLKLFLSLLVAGRTGYVRQLERDVQLGDLLRERLTAGGWRIVNDSVLPVVCFTDTPSEDASCTPGADVGRIDRIVDTIVARGRVWLSSTRVHGEPALRACITSHRTTVADLDVLVDELTAARAAVDALRGTPAAGRTGGPSRSGQPDQKGGER